MQSNSKSVLSTFDQKIFAGFALFTLLCIFGAGVSGVYYWYVLPFLLLFGLWFCVDIKGIYYLMLFSIPLSVEYNFSDSLATDLPDEPLIILLTLVGIPYLLSSSNKFDIRFARHPLVWLLLLQVVWIFIAALHSESWLVSFKFLAAKIWYLTVFVLLAAHFIRNAADFRQVVWVVCLPLTVVVVYCIVRYAQMDFAFKYVNKSVVPFFRNHVNYAVIQAILLPLMFYVRGTLKSGTMKRFLLNICLFVLIMGTILAYTRAVYVALLTLPLLWLMVQKRLTRHFFATILFLALAAGVYLAADNRYLELAPDYERTIQHDTFGGHLSATFEGKDMSFMERIYRWVAAIHMSQDRLLTGFGPNHFYNYYKSYTVSAFETYVSDNPERSSVHNYFLLLLVEQGIIGSLLFIIFCVVILLTGERLYHSLLQPDDRRLAIALVLSQGVILINLLVGDMIEVDEVGSFFYLNVAMLINLDLFAAKQMEE